MAQPGPRDPLALELFDEMARWPILDPHSHVDARRPAARGLDEVLGYHYYTELCHSAGMPAGQADPRLDPRERARNLSRWIDRIDNTIQYSWLEEICRAFHGHDGSPIGPGSIDALLDRADHSADGPGWDEAVWRRSNLEAVFLTNEFDDPLDGFDPARYIPCLRVDDLALKLHEPATRARLAAASNVEVVDLASLRLAIAAIFGHFKARGARACAISLPPEFRPEPAAYRRAVTPIRRALHGMDLREDEHAEIRRTLVWMIAEMCAEHAMPFDLMIGPVRGLYPAGVVGGRDLPDRRAGLRDYAALFGAFPGVTFPVSTLSPDAAAELVAYAWIFPNVVAMGHWWYSNLPAYIAADVRARLQGMPKWAAVGYYSDAYTLEFILPKFQMYRRVLAESLADEFVRGRGWSADRALELARLVLLDNPRRIFGMAPGGASGSA